MSVTALQPDLWAPLPQTDALRRFAVLGDTGSGKRVQFDLARRMLKTYRGTKQTPARPFASVLMLGDNVYEDGEPWLFDKVIRKPYGKLMKQGVRFYPILGNHDVHKGFGDLQMAYWGAPTFYNRRLGSVEIFALDTTVFLPGYDGVYEDNPFLALTKAKVQLDWLKTALAESTAKYKVVMGHYPLYTSGDHAPNPELVRLRGTLEPLLVRYGVDLYLAGHDHHYERTAPIRGVRHMVSGAGGKLTRIDHYQGEPPFAREKLIHQNHFMLFEETPRGLQYEAIAADGAVLDQGLIPPRQVTQLRFA